LAIPGEVGVAKGSRSYDSSGFLKGEAAIICDLLGAFGSGRQKGLSGLVHIRLLTVSLGRTQGKSTFYGTLLGEFGDSLPSHSA